MKPLPSVVQQALSSHAQIPTGSTLVAAVSGGADSIALLHALHKLALRPTVAHVNHQLRGAESDADEAFVKQQAEALGLPFCSTRAEVKAMASERGLSLEMAAREARHTFFRSFGQHAVIALAHHADDQAETFLLKLARGAGPDGLCGMQPRQLLPGLHLIRPMLSLSHAAICSWLSSNNLPWREDRTNQENDVLRNRVRNRVLPLLERELNPNIRAHIGRTMTILQAENEWIDQHLPPHTQPILDTAALSKQPRALQRRLLRAWLFHHNVEASDFQMIETILERCKRAAGSHHLTLNKTQQLVFEYGHLRVQDQPYTTATPEWTLTQTKGVGWKTDSVREVGKLPAEASFNPERIADRPIWVRAPLPGDRMSPFGMTGSKKLQDLFTDQKIPRALRGKIPVVICGQSIIWIPGYRIAKGWEVSSPTAPAIHLHLEQTIASGH